MWTTFFRAIDRTPIISKPTDRATVERGSALSNNECCLASKIYMGHVDSLIGACDGIFVPCIDNLGNFKSFCTKFQALPNVVANTFIEQASTIVSCQVNGTIEHIGMKDAFLKLGADFRCAPHQTKRAWKEALQPQASSAEKLRILRHASLNRES